MLPLGQKRSTSFTQQGEPILPRNRICVLIDRSALEEISLVGGGDPLQTKRLDETNGTEITSIDFRIKAGLVIGLEEVRNDARCQLARVALPPE